MSPAVADATIAVVSEFPRVQIRQEPVTEAALPRPATSPGAKAANITAKAALVVLLGLALLFPDQGHLRDKAAGLRAVGYPLAAFSLALAWWLYWKERISFPWLPDLLVTITCFSDILGNRLDLYDSVRWFDDWMHFMNTGLLTAAVVMLTLPRSSSLPTIIERSLAFGATAAIAWEIAEFFAFISRSSGGGLAYADTLGDLTLGTCGAVVAGCVVHRLWQAGQLPAETPLSLGDK